MKYQVTKGITLGLLALSVWNCKTSDPEPTPYDSGVYILNAGNFFDNNGTISFLSRNTNTVATNILQAANPSLLPSGGIQGYTEVNGKGLILVDNSDSGKDKVEIVEAGTFKSRATLKSPDIENPRQVIQAGPNKAYVSCWDVSGSGNAFYKDPGYIAVIDLNSGTVTKKIPAVKGAEKMVVVGTEAFVGSNTYSGDQTLLVIDLNTDTEKQRIAFGSTPEPLAVDANGKLWIQAGKDLVQIDPSSRIVARRLTFSTAPSSVVMSADKRAFFYVLSGKTYRLPVEATTSLGSQIIARSFNALGVDPQTKRIYGSPSPTLYKQAGYVIRYEENGTLVDSVKAEIAPLGFYFR
jgi:DNA-binding beta-propeller fold protein YncE